MSEQQQSENIPQKSFAYNLWNNKIVLGIILLIVIPAAVYLF